MEKMIIAFLVAVMVGCGTTVKVVKVPVPVQPPRAEMPVMPVLRTEGMDATTDKKEFAKALSLDYASVTGYANECRNLLQVYSKGIDDAYLKSLHQEITIETK